MQVEHIDREAAAEYLALIVPSMPLLAEKVSENKTALSRAFARHRLAERRRVVAFLRSGKGDDLLFALVLASAIEAGEHMK